jgi:hypothetical protein
MISFFMLLFGSIITGVGAILQSSDLVIIGNIWMVGALVYREEDKD